MYSNLRLIAERIFGAALAPHLLWIAPLLVLISFIMLLLPAWRKREGLAWAGETRFAVLTLLLAGAFRVILLGGVVAALSTALMVQGRLFAEKHGRVTQRNSDAIRSKWGVPHEQFDLQVRQFIMRKLVEEQFSDGTREELLLEDRQPAVGDEERTVINQESFGAPAGEGAKSRYLTRRVSYWVRKPAESDSIMASDVTIDVRSNPRILGGAAYAGFEDQWQLTYQVTNSADSATQAVFAFPLPGEGYGVFNRLAVKMDGQDWLPKVRYRNGALTWRMVMQPAEVRTIEVSYSSRGLEYLRYHPGEMREHCLVVLNVQGIPTRHLNYPIGTMSPAEKVSELSGEDYALHWDLSRAVSNFDIGIIVPAQEQPGYYITRLLASAPLGLALLALALLVTRWLISGKLDLLSVALAAVSFGVGNLLLANMNDVVASFPIAFTLSTLPLAAAMALYWKKVDGACFLSAQSAVLYAAFAIYFLLASLSEEAGGTMISVLYAALFIYVAGLVAWTGTLRRREA